MRTLDENMQLKLLFRPSADIIVHKKSVNGKNSIYESFCKYDKT